MSPFSADLKLVDDDFYPAQMRERIVLYYKKTNWPKKESLHRGYELHALACDVK